MIRVKDIQAGLSGLIGWRQDQSATDLSISEPLAHSESGLYYQDIHPLLTLSNMNCIAPDFKNAEEADYYNNSEGTEYYDETKEYPEGKIVTYDGLLYKALRKSVGMAPSESPEDWVATSLFSEWLENKTKGSIQKAVMRYCNEKLSAGTMKSLCENRTLFDGTGRLADVIKNKKNLVGFELVPIRSKGVTLTINKLGVQFTELGSYTFYLMHSSVSTPIQTITIEKTRKNSIEWFPVNLSLPYQSKDTDAGGSWYLCYFQSDLPEGSQAIRKERDWSKGPCKGCSRTEYVAWQAWSKYLEVHPFYVNEENVVREENVPLLWDLEHMDYTYITNYGINLDISVSCDITDFIIEQRTLFIDVIAKQVAVDMLRELAFNPNVRTNRHSINASKVDILYELDGDSASMKKSGLNYQLDLAHKALIVSLAGLDRVCQPCKNNGVKYRTI